MPAQDLWWSYWYFHFPNYAFAVLFWTLVGRFMFGLFLRPDSPNYIYRWFRRLTDWLMRPVDVITHTMIPRVLLPMVAAFWVALARVAFFMAIYAAGLAPRLPAAG
jgi:YggT family protein